MVLAMDKHTFERLQIPSNFTCFQFGVVQSCRDVWSPFPEHCKIDTMAYSSQEPHYRVNQTYSFIPSHHQMRMGENREDTQLVFSRCATDSRLQEAWKEYFSPAPWLEIRNPCLQVSGTRSLQGRELKSLAVIPAFQPCGWLSSSGDCQGWPSELESAMKSWRTKQPPHSRGSALKDNIPRFEGIILLNFSYFKYFYGCEHLYTHCWEFSKGVWSVSNILYRALLWFKHYICKRPYSALNKSHRNLFILTGLAAVQKHKRKTTVYTKMST